VLSATEIVTGSSPSVRPAVYPSACIRAAYTGRIYVIFDIGDFYNICREIPILGTLHEDLNMFYCFRRY
jgi:hypothetical protein